MKWIHIAFVFAVSIMPFSIKLLSEFIQYRTALVCYWANVMLLGLVLYLSGRCVHREGLMKDRTPPEIGKAIVRRIMVGQALLSGF